jgi:hypothetical protein
MGGLMKQVLLAQFHEVGTTVKKCQEKLASANIDAESYANISLFLGHVLYELKKFSLWDPVNWPVVFNSDDDDEDDDKWLN